MAKASPCKDHTGRWWNSRAEMCAHYNVSIDTYDSRRRKGYSVEWSLTAPLQKQKYYLHGTIYDDSKAISDYIAIKECARVLLDQCRSLDQMDGLLKQGFELKDFEYLRFGYELLMFTTTIQFGEHQEFVFARIVNNQMPHRMTLNTAFCELVRFNFLACILGAISIKGIMASGYEPVPNFRLVLTRKMSDVFKNSPTDDNGEIPTLEAMSKVEELEVDDGQEETN